MIEFSKSMLIPSVSAISRYFFPDASTFCTSSAFAEALEKGEYLFDEQFEMSRRIAGDPFGQS